jgi:sec-independent protein translocase protein TatA
VTLLFLESIGTTELLLILIAALVLFGPRRLPELSRSLGKGLNEFKRASDEFKRTWEREASLDTQERERKIGDAMLPPDAPRAAGLPDGNVIPSEGNLIAAPPAIALDATEGSQLIATDGAQVITTDDSQVIARGDAGGADRGAEYVAASAEVHAPAEATANGADAATAPAPQSPHKTDWL